MGICFQKPKGMHIMSLTNEVNEEVKQDIPNIRRPNARLSVVLAHQPQIDETPFFQIEVPEFSSTVEDKLQEQYLTESKLLIKGAPYDGNQQGFADKKLKIEGDLSEFQRLNKLGVGFSCKKGLKPDFNNQDDLTIILDTEFKFFGVFDGHGTNGHHISHYVHSLLPDLILSNKDFVSNPQKAITEGFIGVNQNLLKHTSNPEVDFDCKLSGTTATTILIKSNRIYVGHVGDSRAVLALKVNNLFEARRITTDHKPNLPLEMERILASNGVVRRLPDDVPYRIFLKGREYPGLSTSRAIGDSIAQAAGVISIPEVVEMEISDDFKFIIMCSDGV